MGFAMTIPVLNLEPAEHQSLVHCYHLTGKETESHRSAVYKGETFKVKQVPQAAHVVFKETRATERRLLKFFYCNQQRVIGKISITDICQ